MRCFWLAVCAPVGGHEKGSTPRVGSILAAASATAVKRKAKVEPERHQEGSRHAWLSGAGFCGPAHCWVARAARLGGLFARFRFKCILSHRDKRKARRRVKVQFVSILCAPSWPFLSGQIRSDARGGVQEKGVEKNRIIPLRVRHGASLCWPTMMVSLSATSFASHSSEPATRSSHPWMPI